MNNQSNNQRSMKENPLTVGLAKHMLGLVKPGDEIAGERFKHILQPILKGSKVQHPEQLSELITAMMLDGNKPEILLEKIGKEAENSRYKTSAPLLYFLLGSAGSIHLLFNEFDREVKENSKQIIQEYSGFESRKTILQLGPIALIPASMEFKKHHDNRLLPTADLADEFSYAWAALLTELTQVHKKLPKDPFFGKEIPFVEHDPEEWIGYAQKHGIVKVAIS